MPRFLLTRSIVPSFSRVDDPTEVEHYRTACLKLWRGRAPSNTNFPGCNPCSLSRDALHSVATNTYVISLKSDGVRHALFLTLRPDGKPIALMIDRTWAMFEVVVVAPEAFFTRGTILEGEVVWQQPDAARLVYLVFDAVVVKGRNVTSLPFGERLMQATACTRLSGELSDAADLEARALETDSIVMAHYEPEITMRPKTFVAREHATRLWDHRHEVDHRVDGIILHRYESVYHIGTATNHSVLKWKKDATIDLRASSPLGVHDGALGDSVCGLSVVVDDSRLAYEPSDVVEFLVTVRDGAVHLFAVRTRPDKTGPNSRHVVEATVRDVLEHIAAADIVSA
jgi:mRNA-capping enzyme